MRMEEMDVVDCDDDGGGGDYGDLHGHHDGDHEGQNDLDHPVDVDVDYCWDFSVCASFDQRPRRPRQLL